MNYSRGNGAARRVVYILVTIFGSRVAQWALQLQWLASPGLVGLWVNIDISTLISCWGPPTSSGCDCVIPIIEEDACLSRITIGIVIREDAVCFGLIMYKYICFGLMMSALQICTHLVALDRSLQISLPFNSKMKI